MLICFFFFQAEDGIRDIGVTGVQTCALPISPGIVAGQEQMARSIDRIAATQEQLARTVDQLTANQEQAMREITKLQAVEQYILYKSSEPPPRPAPARNPAPRPSLVPIVR